MNTLLWWLGQNSITVAVMIPVVLLACRMFRHRPAVQHVLWLIVLLKFVTPPLVAWPWTIEQLAAAIVPSPVAAWITNERSNLPSATDMDVVGSDRLPVGDRVDDPLEILLQEARQKENSSTAEADVLAAGALSNSAKSVNAAWIAIRVACLVWLVGAVGSLVFQIRRIFRHAWLVRHSSLANASLTNEIHVVAAQLGLKPPRTLIARGILSPFVWFLGRLRLVWPELLASKSEIVRARGVIAHELAHVLRGDHWVAWLELVAGIVWWWNPLFWYVRRRLRDTAEMACDAVAIGTFPEQRRDYAELLLELSAGFKSGAPAHVLAVSAGTPYSFERRLSMILSDCVSGKLSSWGILTAIGLALVALPGWSIGQQESPPPADVVAAAAAPEKEKEKKREDSSPAEDRLLRELIEQGKFDQAKARLEALRAKQAADKAIADGVFPAKWKDALLKELPAACVKGMPENATFSWKLCMSCHAVPSNQPATTESKPPQVWFNDKVKGKEIVPFAADEQRLIEQAFQAIHPKNKLPDQPRLSTDSRPILGFRGNSLIYMVIFEGQGATLEATTSVGGKILWKSQFADSLPGRKSEDKWSLEESKDGKQVVLSWTRDEGRVSYYFDSHTGKILSQEKVANPNSSSSTGSTNTGDVAQSLSESVRLKAFEDDMVRQLRAGSGETANSGKGNDATSYRQLAIDHFKDVYKAKEAQHAAGLAELRRLQSLLAAGNVSHAELEVARQRVEELQKELLEYRDWLEPKLLSGNAASSQQLKAIDAQRAAASANYEKALKQFHDKAITQQDLNATKAEAAAAEARWKNLKEVESDVRIYLQAVRDTSAPAAKPANSLSDLDLAERYLRATADLKNARSRMDRVKGTEGAVSQKEIDESRIELERAEKTAKFLAAYIQDAVKAAQAEAAAAQLDSQRIEQLHKKGFVAATELDAAKARFDAALARMKQLESINALGQ